MYLILLPCLVAAKQLQVFTIQKEIISFNTYSYDKQKQSKQPTKWQLVFLYNRIIPYYVSNKTLLGGTFQPVLYKFLHFFLKSLKIYSFMLYMEHRILNRIKALFIFSRMLCKHVGNKFWWVSKSSTTKCT